MEVLRKQEQGYTVTQNTKTLRKSEGKHTRNEWDIFTTATALPLACPALIKKINVATLWST